MATRGERRTDVNEDIAERVGSIIDRDDWGSSYGFAKPRTLVEQDAAKEHAEMLRNPEAVRAILTEMDSDANILLQVIASRRGIRGAWNGVWNNWAGRMVGSVGVGMAIRTGVRAGLHLAGPAASAVGGGAAGGFWGWMRGRNQQESAATWMANLDILSKSKTDMSKMTEADLYTALGIMKNAMDARNVRGNAQAKLEYISKYRLMKEVLRDRRNERLAENKELNPVMSRIDQALADAGDESKEIARMASEETRETYDQIFALKRKAEIMTAVKGAMVGAAFGGVIGTVVDYAQHHGGMHGVNDWISEHILHTQSHEQVLHDALDAKRASLTDAAYQEDLQHFQTMQNNFDVYNQDMGQGMVPPEHIDMVGHINAIKEFGGDRALFGFDQATGLGPTYEATFNQYLQSGNLHEMFNLADHSNLDLSVAMPDGGQFGQFLVDNKETFLSFPPDIQHFILSHPSLATDFLDLAHNSSADAASASLMAKIAGGVGVAAVAGYLGIDKAQRGNEKAQRRLTDEAKDVRRKENAENRSEKQAEKRDKTKENKENVKQELIGATVMFTTLPAGYVIGTRDRRFEITDIDASGRLVFKMTEADRKKLSGPTPVNPHPEFSLDDILTAEGTIDRNLVNVVSRGRGSSPEIEPEEEFDKEAYEKYLGKKFTGKLKRLGGDYILTGVSKGAPSKKMIVKSPRIAELAMLPSGADIDVVILDVDKDGKDLIWEVDAYINVSGDDYNLEGKFGITDKKKDKFVDSLKSLAGAGYASNCVLYASSFGRFLQLDSFTAPNFEFKPFDPATGTFGTPVSLDESSLKAMEFSYFSKVTL
ncbi:MAG: hypothetical protein WC080_03875 [Patescibacteria group bacterium]